MKSVNIRLTMMTDHVKNFVSLVNRYPYDMDLRSGRYVVDAKSILGVMSLGMTKGTEIRIVAEGPDEDAAFQAMQQLVDSGCGE